MLSLALSSCGGSGHAEQASAPTAPSVVSSSSVPTSPGSAATTTGVSTSAGSSAGSADAPGGSAGAKAPAATKGGAASAARVPGPVPLNLDPTAVYDDWTFTGSSAATIQLDIKDNSCNGVPNTSVTETATSVTILVTEQVLHDGNPACKGVPKAVGMLASILAPLGKRFLEGCRPALEKAGRKVNCRTGSPA
jgi:hypothetical protein